MKFKMLLIALVLSLSGLLEAEFTHLKLEVCTDATGNKCVVQVYMADSGAFDTGINFQMQSELKLPVVGNVTVSGVVSSEKEDYVMGYIRPVALWNTVKRRWQNVKFELQKHKMTVSHSLLFGNPQQAAFGLVVDPASGVLLMRSWCTVPAGKQFDFYRLK